MEFIISKILLTHDKDEINMQKECYIILFYLQEKNGTEKCESTTIKY